MTLGKACLFGGAQADFAHPIVRGVSGGQFRGDGRGSVGDAVARGPIENGVGQSAGIIRKHNGTAARGLHPMGGAGGLGNDDGTTERERLDGGAREEIGRASCRERVWR